MCGSSSVWFFTPAGLGRKFWPAAQNQRAGGEREERPREARETRERETRAKERPTMEVEPPVGDATAPAVAAAAAESGDTYVAPSEEEQDAPPADGIVLSDRVLGYYGNPGRDARTAEQRSVVRDLGLKWGEYYVPNDMLDQLRDDCSEGSDEKMEIMEEEEAEEEAVYEDAMARLGMKMVDDDAVMDDETTRASSLNSIVSSNRKGGRKGDVPVLLRALPHLWTAFRKRYCSIYFSTSWTSIGKHRTRSYPWSACARRCTGHCGPRGSFGTWLHRGQSTVLARWPMEERLTAT